MLVVFQLILARRIFPKGHPSRRWGALTLLFTITEALLGAKLVLFGLVDKSVDLARLLVMPLHLVNTSLLLFSAVMCAQTSRSDCPPRSPIPEKARRWWWLLASVLLVMLTSGAIAALGTHLEPSQSLLSGLASDADPSSHPAVRLRLLHPVLGLLLPMLLIVTCARLKASAPSDRAAAAYLHLAVTVVFTVAVGLTTLLLLSPVPMKLIHLTAANLVVIAVSLAYYQSVYVSSRISRAHRDTDGARAPFK